MSAEEVAYCHVCKAAMDVSAVEPFTNVQCPSCGEATRVKREFGPYTLSRRHAIGGMSLVFVAEDATLGREVIVKILNKEYSADEKRIAAFEEEARITASISHPNVVRVFTTGRAFDRFYIAMEFVTGGHFEQHIADRGTIPETEALELALHVVSGLKAAKASGLIHRDVKPGNILLDSNGSAKLVDFGLALVTKGGKATASEIWATPYYVPPETIEGAEEDFRSDIYAFGATMYHALAGKPPCDEESMDTKRLRAAKQQIQPLHRVAGWLHPETCAVIDRCMAYAPDDRFRSYDSLSASLRSALQIAGSGVPPPPKTTLQSMSSAPRRAGSSLGQKLALASAILVVLVSIAFSAKMVLEGSKRPADPGGGQTGGATGGGTSGGGNYQPTESGSLKVAKLYAAASEAVADGRFDEARSNFGLVRDHPEVLEPTGSWAAVEAVMAALLEGDSDAARSEMGKVRKHIDGAGGLSAKLRKQIAETMAQLGGLESIPFPKDPPKSSNESMLVSMLCGLKNWDQGQIDQALPFFKEVASQRPSESRGWLTPYITWAQSYLNDAKRLKDAEPGSFDVDEAIARGLADELEGVYNQLETRGRARFNVRCWQMALERKAKVSAENPRPVAPNESENGEPAGLIASLKACRFAESAGMIRDWKPSDEEEAARRDAYLQLVQASQAFLADLGESAQELSPEVPIKSRNGRTFTKVASGDAHHLEVQANEAEPVKLRWPEIEPESLIALHRAVTKGGGQDLDSLRRHEHAVAFDFIAGNRQRAIEAAARLSEVSELFDRRWKSLVILIQD
jgi:serine/threonine protein kinase